MAEWFKRGTVNTFNRGSNPLKAYKLKFLFFNFLTKNKFRYHPTAFLSSFSLSRLKKTKRVNLF